MDSERAGPLDGIRVVDLTIARAGPTCVRQLADLGADVVRVVNPRAGDLGGSDARNLHRNKRSIALDLKREAAQPVLWRLIEAADVLVENFRAPVKARLGIDYPRVRARNPRLVYASLSGFGQDGPYAERPAVDQIVQGMAGLMSVTGPPGGGPWRAGLAISDVAAGTLLAQGVMAALYERERSGEGQWVHTSLLETLVNFMDFQAARWLADGAVPGQEGNDHPTIFPMGAFRAADGWLNIAPALDFAAFARALDAETWLDDARFADFAARAEHREALRGEIEARLAKRTCTDWVERINAAGVACGPVLAMDAVFADPQVEHLGLAAVVEDAPDAPPVVRSALNFSRNRTRLVRDAPAPGADTDAILAELGYDAEARRALVDEGAAATATDAPAAWNRA